MYDALPERFWDKVEPCPMSGCWNWTAATNGVGYGRIQMGAKSKVTGKPNASLSHRVAYESLVGPIPEGLQMDHLCRNRACCNPAHLEPVTSRENTIRGNAPEATRARHAANRKRGGSHL